MKGLLQPNEKIVFAFTPNLDPSLRFGEGYVILTDQALIGSQPKHSGASDWAFQRWALEEIHDLKKLDRAGLAILEILGRDRLLQSWKFTAAKNNQCGQLVAQYKQLKAGSLDPSELAGSICMSC